MSVDSGDGPYNVEGSQIETETDLSSKALSNEDIMPTSLERRNWGVWDISALWVSMCITLALYYAISPLVAAGLTWLQVVMAVLLGNLLIFIPLVINGHAGTKYGIPFPVMVRSSFGIHGAHIPAIFRGLVACGWFGVQSWIGGLAIHVSMQNVVELTGYEWIWPQSETFLGMSYPAGEFLGFFIFWGLCVWIVWEGIESIRWLEVLGAPFLILCFVALFGWVWYEAGGFMRVLTEGMQSIGAAEGLSGKEFWFVFIPGLMAMIGYWATLSLNIPDFTRYSESQTSQATGQFLGLNLTMAPFAFLIAFITAGSFLVFMPHFAQENLQEVILEQPGIQQELGLEETAATRTATVEGYLQDHSHEEVLAAVSGTEWEQPVQEAIQSAEEEAQGLWDPMVLLNSFEQPLVVIVVMVAFAIATLTTNIAANVVAPANSFSNVAPQYISFRVGGLIAGVIAVLTCPWVLMNSPGFYIEIWLGGAAGLLAPLGGIMIGDYLAYRKTQLDLDQLYEQEGKYRYNGGFNVAGIITLVLSIALLFPGWFLELLKAQGYVEESDPFQLWASGEYFLSTMSWIWLVNWIFGFTFSLVVYWGLAHLIYGDPDETELVSAG